MAIGSAATMTLDGLDINIVPVLPEVALTGLALALLILDLVFRRRHKRGLGYLGALGLLSALPLVLATVTPEPAFGATVIADSFAAFFKAIFIISAILTLLMSVDYLERHGIRRGEYYYTVVFATVGMMVMTSALDLINLYVGLELMALSFYILVAFRVDSRRSVEGALKYFILGALSSGVLLYGMSFAYGFAGTTNLEAIARMSAAYETPNPLLLLSIALVTAGFSFKVAAFPFHLWAPDAYEGAPTPVAAFLSVGSKAAAFAVLLRVFVVAFPAVKPYWADILWGLSAATMVFGSVVAIAQRNIVRMLAYSSIAHAGIILMGLLSYNRSGISGILYYLLVYAFMNMGAFTVVAVFVRENGRGEAMSDYKGLASERPVLALVMALFLLSLAGVPPTGGFAAKFFILASAIEARYYLLAAIGVVATAVSLFFYAKVIFYMYMREPDGHGREATPTGYASLAVLTVAAVATVLLGVYPAPFMDMAIEAVRPLIM
jgi:NADH-quinone oxidoreductase subunit N